MKEKRGEAFVGFVSDLISPDMERVTEKRGDSLL